MMIFRCLLDSDDYLPRTIYLYLCFSLISRAVARFMLRAFNDSAASFYLLIDVKTPAAAVAGRSFFAFR